MMKASELLTNGEFTLERVAKDALYLFRIFLVNGFSETQAEELTVIQFRNADLERRALSRQGERRHET